jgi:VanZ family protein
VAATLLASAYGATDEYHQMFVPLRHAELADWIADTIGASIGAAGDAAARSAFSARRHRRRADPAEGLQ